MCYTKRCCWKKLPHAGEPINSKDRTAHIGPRASTCAPFQAGVLFAESARRMRARQKTPPRIEVLRPCPKCGAPYGARKLRAHIPSCTGMPVTSPNPHQMIRKIINLADQDAENYRYWQSLPLGERLAAVCEVTEAAYSLQKVR